MPRTSPGQKIATLLLGALLPCPAALAKPAADPLAPTRASLDALKACLGASDALATLRKGLLWGWPKPGGPPTLRDPAPAPPPPPEYSQTLDRDVKACTLASTLNNEEQRRLVLTAVQKDIEIKAADCHKFGMGRKVPVTIKTVRGDKMEHGWQVFYKWSCASLLQPEEVRVPNLTSPANVELPPGVYLGPRREENVVKPGRNRCSRKRRGRVGRLGSPRARDSVERHDARRKTSRGLETHAPGGLRQFLQRLHERVDHRGRVHSHSGGELETDSDLCPAARISHRLRVAVLLSPAGIRLFDPPPPRPRQCFSRAG